MPPPRCECSPFPPSPGSQIRPGAGKDPEGKGVCASATFITTWLKAMCLAFGPGVAVGRFRVLWGNYGLRHYDTVIRNNESDNLCRGEGPNPAYLIFHQ